MGRSHSRAKFFPGSSIKRHCPSVAAHFRCEFRDIKDLEIILQSVMPSRVFSAAVMYMLLALFAARTLGDNQLNTFLQHSVRRRVRDKKANVVGAHNISFSFLFWFDSCSSLTAALTRKSMGNVLADF